MIQSNPTVYKKHKAWTLQWNLNYNNISLFKRPFFQMHMNKQVSLQFYSWTHSGKKPLGDKWHNFTGRNGCLSCHATNSIKALKNPNWLVSQLRKITAGVKLSWFSTGCWMETALLPSHYSRTLVPYHTDASITTLTEHWVAKRCVSRWWQFNCGVSMHCHLVSARETAPEMLCYCFGHFQ